jgi:hypothetical protein
MHARVATFAVDDRDKIDGEIATTCEYTADGPPSGIPAKEFLMLIDRDGGKVVEVMLFETEDDLRTGDERLNGMSPGPGSIRRISIETFEVPVHVTACVLRQDPNQRSRRVEANSSFSAASSREGPISRAVGAGPPRKFASTFPTSSRPNSM